MNKEELMMAEWLCEGWVSHRTWMRAAVGNGSRRRRGRRVDCPDASVKQRTFL